MGPPDRLLACIVIAATVGCDTNAEQRHQSVDTSHVAVAPVQLADTIHAVSRDLDHDGSLDTIVFYLSKQGGVRYAYVRVCGATLSAVIRLLGDGAPEIVDYGDLDGDGVEDLLLADVDLDVIWAGALLVRPDSLTIAKPAASVSPEATWYGWDPTAGHGACRSELMPRIEALSDGTLVVSMASGEAITTADCMNPNRNRFRVFGDSLVHIK
jgi:hypothetical protein